MEAAEVAMGLGAWGAIIGVILSTVASGFSALGNVLLKWSHENNLAKPVEEQKPAYKRCHWYGIDVSAFFFLCNLGFEYF